MPGHGQLPLVTKSGLGRLWTIILDQSRKATAEFSRPEATWYSDLAFSHRELLPCRYTVTGSEDGVLRLWNSRDVYEAAVGLKKEAPTSSQNSDSTLASPNGGPP